MIRVYQSTDVGAPQNINAAGSIISILAACLVTGYGTQAAAGWSMPFQDVNTAAFKPGAGSNGMHLKITDTAITAARVKCFESMTDINTGLGQFPTEIQQAGGLYFQKGDHATLPRLWSIIATEKFFVAFFETAVGTQKMHCFGDFDSYKAGDLFNTVAIFHSTVAGTESTTLSASGIAAIAGHFIARMHTGIGGSIACGKGAALTGQTALGATCPFPYPSPIDGSLHLSPVVINEPLVGFRGVLPLLFNINHTKPFQNLDKVIGTGDFLNNEFLALNLGTSEQVLVKVK